MPTHKTFPAGMQDRVLHLTSQSNGTLVCLNCDDPCPPKVSISHQNKTEIAGDKRAEQEQSAFHGDPKSLPKGERGQAAQLHIMASFCGWHECTVT